MGVLVHYSAGPCRGSVVLLSEMLPPRAAAVRAPRTQLLRHSHAVLEFGAEVSGGIPSDWGMAQTYWKDA